MSNFITMLCGSRFVYLSLVIVLVVILREHESARLGRRRPNRCPRVKAIRNFHIDDMMGFWHVVQYYASSEETPEYACMRSSFSFAKQELMHVTMNFSYIYAEDPSKQPLYGNISWYIPNTSVPAHWMHTEYIYEGIYNTYVIDTDYKTWALIMHCAEKAKSPKYLSALLLARTPKLQINEINFLREKLPRYDIDLSFMFDIDQESCDSRGVEAINIP